MIVRFYQEIICIISHFMNGDGAYGSFGELQMCKTTLNGLGLTKESRGIDFFTLGVVRQRNFSFNVKIMPTFILLVFIVFFLRFGLFIFVNLP